MFILKSENIKALPVSDTIGSALSKIDTDWLREAVSTMSVPRSFEHEYENNCRIRDWIEETFQEFGFQTLRVGKYDNVVAWLPTNVSGKALAAGPERDEPAASALPLTFKDCDLSPTVLVGAHYDTKPNTPGADDNASAVAAMLECAKAIAKAHQFGHHQSHCVFVAFNREEDGLLGSHDFVENDMPDSWDLKEVHILEMVGYCDHTPGSQGLPKGLPVKLEHDRGDFLAIVANRKSNSKLRSVLQTAATYVPGFPVWGLKVFFGLENRFSDLRRSDHAPFWDKGIPAFMWTDTSEFRNANYHLPSDTPETLDYEFLTSVTRLLAARVLRN